MQYPGNGAARARIDRRSVLVGAAALGAAVAWGCNRTEAKKARTQAGFSREGLDRMRAAMAAHA